VHGRALWTGERCGRARPVEAVLLHALRLRYGFTTRLFAISVYAFGNFFGHKNLGRFVRFTAAGAKW